MPVMYSRSPPLPLTVQLVSVAVPELDRPPPIGELPLTVQLVSVAVPTLNRPPLGGVAADGAVGQRGRAVDCPGRRRWRSCR